MAACVALASASPQRTSGLDPASLDASIRPQDDLYGHVNARWLTGTVIPPDRVSHTSFSELGDKVELDVLAIINDVAARPGRRHGSEAQQVADMFKSVTDEAAIEALGGTPLRAALGRIEAIATYKELAAETGHLSAIAAGGPFAGTIGNDPEDPTRLIAQIAQGGTLLPDRETYFSADARSIDVRAKYEAYLASLFRLIDRVDPIADAKAVLALETELARAHWTAADSRNPSNTMARFSFAQLAREMPGFDWQAWGAPQGLTRTGAVILSQPSFFKRFAALVPTVPLETWKLWLASRYITYASPFVSDAFGNARFEFFGRVLTGQELPRPRWKRGVGLVNGYLGDAVGRLYVEKHFPPESRTRVQALVSRIRLAFKEAIGAADWMKPATKRAALDKLSRLREKIGYPDAWRSYRGLVVKPDDLLGNVQRAQQFDNGVRMARVAARDNPREWPVTPQTVNAFYSPATNEIVLPAAILQPPFFDPAADDAVNYGAIGGVVGHELAHGFDSRGRRYDANGADRDWWTAEDEQAYLTRAAMLVAQFDAYSPLPGLRVNGQATLIENMGDLGGLAVAYRAYKMSLDGRPSPVIDGITGEQRLFMGWARAWRARVRDDYMRQVLLTEPHAPARYRVNGPASNLQEFYEAFGVKPGDRLHRDPGQRVRVW
jgi:predicted metalloendopeptidase